MSAQVREFTITQNIKKFVQLKKTIILATPPVCVLRLHVPEQLLSGERLDDFKMQSCQITPP